MNLFIKSGLSRIKTDIYLEGFMKSLKITLTLLILPLFLVYCGGKQPKTVLNGTGNNNVEQENTVTVAAIPQDVVSCMTGVYSGTGDIRWNLGLNFGFADFNSQDLKVSIAFQGDSALIKVDGEEGDLLCTHYERVMALDSNLPPGATKISKERTISANKVTSVQKKGTAYYSKDLADSLNNDILVENINQSKCTFSIGSVSIANGRFGRDRDSIKSENLRRKKEENVDFQTLLDECGGLSSFTITLPEEEITEKPKPDPGPS